MPLVIHYSREIAAPLAIVWEVVTDFDAYGQWNPFVVGCRSTLRAGEPIDMKVRLFPSFVQSQRETVLEYRDGERFCYGLSGSAIRSRRCHEARPLDGGLTSYVSHFELSGWLSGLVRALLGARLERGFRSMTDALQARAESLAASRNRAADAP